MTSFKQLISIFLILGFVSCSSSKNLKEENEVESENDSVALEDENDYEDEDSIYENQYSDETIQEKDEVALAPVAEEQPQDEVSDQKPLMSETLSEYTVLKGESLMLIAFKIYGNYSKWTSIQEQNPELASNTQLHEGQKIQVMMPAEEFKWRPDGEPYLIKHRDTLQTISNNIYDTTNKWRELYQHNRKLIKDPNIIFAGFTIFYLPVEEYNRDPANQDI